MGALCPMRPKCRKRFMLSSASVGLLTITQHLFVRSLYVNKQSGVVLGPRTIVARHSSRARGISASAGYLKTNSLPIRFETPSKRMLCLGTILAHRGSKLIDCVGFLLAWISTAHI